MNVYDRVLLNLARWQQPAWVSGSAFRKFCRRNRGWETTAETRHGFRFNVQLGDSVENKIFVHGDFEPSTTRVFKAVATQCQHFVDVGCNVGYFSCLVHQCSPAASISCVDANPAMVKRTLENLALNGCQAEGYNFGVSDAEDELTLYIPKRRHSLSSFAYQPDKGGDIDELKIPVLPLGRIVDFSAMDNIFLKVDTEGFEFNVFSGLSKEEIAKLKAVVFECNANNFERSSRDVKELFKLPLFADLEAYEIIDNAPGLKKIDHVTGPFPADANVLLLRPELVDTIFDRLKKG